MIIGRKTENKPVDVKKMEVTEEKYRGRKMHYESYDKNNFIISSIPIMQENFREEEYDENWSNEKKLDVIVQRERRRINRMVDREGNKYNIKEDSLRGDCVMSQLMVSYDCGEKNINVREIYNRDYKYKGNKKEIELNRFLGHLFTIIELDNTYYLIDCTYRQFFSELFNNREIFDVLHNPRYVYDNR